MASTSSGVKSTNSLFSFNRDSLRVFGITEVPLAMPQERRTWQGVILCLCVVAEIEIGRLFVDDTLLQVE